MPASTVAAVKAALLVQVAALLAANTNPPVQVRYGPRGPLTRADLVSIGNVVGQVNLATLGPTRRRDEDYVVTITISCSRPGADTQQAATEAALALYEQIEAYLRGLTAENLGVPAVAWARWEGDFSVDESADPDVQAVAANTTVTLPVTVKARV